MGNVHGANHCANTWEAIKKELFGASKKLRICVTGAAGLMGSAICWHLKSQGHYIIACDWRNNELMAVNEFWHEYHVVDPTDMDNCLNVTRGVDLVFNFATSTGGLGFSESNLSMTKDNDTLIGFSMAEAARINGVRRFFHASVAYIFRELNARLAEHQYPFVFEKPETEMLCERYYEEFGFESRIGRLDCIYDPSGTWEGRRGKARAAIMDSYVKEVLRLMKSDCREPVYIGSLNMRELETMGSDEIASENEKRRLGSGLQLNRLCNVLGFGLCCEE